MAWNFSGRCQGGGAAANFLGKASEEARQQTFQTGQLGGVAAKFSGRARGEAGRGCEIFGQRQGKPGGMAVKFSEGAGEEALQ